MKPNKNKIPTCTSCSITHKTVFNHLTPNELDLINFEKSCNYYKKGDIVFHEGNRGNGVYCVNSGILKLFKTGIDGKEQIIRFAKPGNLIGFRSILSNECACTTAKALEDLVLCFIPANIFVELVKKNHDFSLFLIKLSCKELGESNKFILDMAQKKIRERLAEVLLLLKDNFGLNKHKILQVSLTREEIANIVGTAKETIIRELSEFKKEKLIELAGRKIKLIDIKKLERISNAY